MPETGLQGAKVLAERLRAKIEEWTFSIKDKEAKITACIGVTELLDSMKTEVDFLDTVDKAMYKAKLGGRNQVACYE